METHEREELADPRADFALALDEPEGGDRLRDDPVDASDRF
jgi:hypothetical protein